MTTIENPGCLSLLFDQVEPSILIVGRDDGVIRRVNYPVCKATGRTFDELHGHHYRHVFWPEFISVYNRLVEECLDGKEHTTIYYWGEMTIWEQITARVIRWEDSPCVLMSITNISDVARTEYRLESIAYFDNLLKLPNGAKLEEDINELAGTETIALIYFGVERLGEINNLYGWDNGDALLKQIRDYLLFSESRRAQIYRLENGFAVLGRKVSMPEAEIRAEEILNRFDRPWAVSAAGSNISVYCAVRMCVVYGKYIQNGMRNILLRTVRITPPNKGRYTLYDEQADREATRSLALRDSLINCINDGMIGFDVYYQPIVDTKSERWAALEALCRWRTPDGQRVPPLEFIHVAEQLDLVGKVDSWVRETAMNHCKSLRLDDGDFVLDVNFSPTSKVDDAFIDDLMDTLRRTDFPPEKLNLEITESAKMVFDKQTLAGLRRLRETGIILSLDDFGTGYSSLANLIHISARALKTERMFLVDIENNPYRRYLFKMLVDLAHYHGMSFIAEGVETREQLEFLRGMGVDMAQGYLFAKPMPYRELVGVIERFEGK